LTTDAHRKEMVMAASGGLSSMGGKRRQLRSRVREFVAAGASHPGSIQNESR
jgi:hypothetical protein